MDALEVFDPSGATEVTELHAPRIDNLDGKRTTVGWVSPQREATEGGQEFAGRRSASADARRLTGNDLFMVRMMWAEMNGFISDVVA